jgi:hypothetical protein
MSWMTHNASIRNIASMAFAILMAPRKATPARQAPAMLDGGVCVGGKGLRSLLNSFCTKNRRSIVVALRCGRAACRCWKRRGVQVTGAGEWSIASTIVLRLGKEAYFGLGDLTDSELERWWWRLDPTQRRA